METAVGVFAARERAEQAVKSLLEKNVTKESIVYLTRSESEAKSVGKELGAYAGGFVGGAAGLSAGVAAATLLAIPGIGPVFALGFGAAALLGLVGAGTGAAVGQNAAQDHEAPAPTAGPDSSTDAAFFRKVLEEGHSLVVVRTESPEMAATACQILDELSINMKKGSSQKSKISTREFGDAVVVDVVGRIALTDGTALLRDTARALVERGDQRIILNMSSVDFIDSSGIGELIRMQTSVQRHGGQLRLVSPSKHVHDLLKMTKLDRVLEIEADESSALNSFTDGPSKSAASA
jgi:anti-sigma B factor antagonist